MDCTVEVYVVAGSVPYPDRIERPADSYGIRYLDVGRSVLSWRFIKVVHHVMPFSIGRIVEVIPNAQATARSGMP